jgi:signal transduction histidine kinase
MLEHPALEQQYEAWEKQYDYEQILSGDELISYYNHTFFQTSETETGNGKPVKPEYGYYFAFQNGLFYSWAHEPYSDTEKNILNRFRSIIALTFRRFLDLQKAESQARESQIQLALERVRARTMAMQHSDELADASFLLDSQVRSLGIKTRGCAFNIYNDNESTEWFSSEAGTMPTYKTPRENIFLRYYEAGQSGKIMHIEEFEGETCISHYDYLCTLPVMGDALKKMKESGGSFPLRQIDHVIYFKYGYLLFITFEHVPEAHDIFIRFAKVFEQTYTRFLDLQKAEAQAREAQIQLSLERIRAKAMAMQHSDELGDFLTVVFEQFEVLNLNPVNCHLSFFDIDNNRITFRLTGKNGATLIASQEIDLDASPLLKQKIEDWKSGHPKEVDVLYIPYESIPEVGEIFKEILEKLPVSECPLPEDYPNGEYITEGYCKYGYLGYSASRPPSYEEKEITRRIANEFGNVYQRFLDLQKAEAQAREAQIENALEKVRSRTMGMQHSDELTDVAGLLFNQVSILGIKTWTTGFNVWSEDNNSYVDYLSFGEGFIEPITVHTEKAEALRDVSNARKSGVEFDVLYVEGEKLKQLYLALTNWDEKQYEKLLQDGVIPAQQYEHFVFGSKVSLMFITYEPVPEAHDIFKRLGKVFEQTYTRFLDLQKAEAQAREAQIETALERIRSRALAMYNSAEVGDVSDLLFSELEKMDINPTGFSIMVFDREHDKYELWRAKEVAHQGVYETFSIQAMYDKLDQYIPGFTEELESKWNSRSPLFIAELSGKKRISFLEANREMGNYTDDQFENVLKIYPDPIFWHLVFFKHGWLGLIQNEQLPADVLQVIRRFADVFEFAHTRFLDLQKAEAQAREAQIEASLERLRSKTMAMHNSNDVGESVATMFNELERLEVKTKRCGVLIHGNSAFTEVWTARSNPDGKAALIIGHLDMTIHPMLSGVRNSWLNKESSFTYELAGEDIKNYFQAINDSKNYPYHFNINTLPSKEFHSDFHFRDGSIFAFTAEPIPEEALLIFNRFAGVFGQTYRRYLDLQKAEAQAHEAQIEAALERVRASTMAMHKSEQLAETAKALFDQFDLLGKIPDRISIGIIKEEKQLIEWWVTNQNGSQLNYGFNASIAEPSMAKVFTAWKGKKDSIVIDLTGKDLQDWIRFVREEVKMEIDEANMKGRRVHQGAFFSQGVLLFSTHEPVANDVMQLLVRFARVFNQTYTRFLDLQKAEAQAREAQIEAALERVRSKAMSMHSSEDLNATIGAFYRELEQFSITPRRCGVGLLQKENRVAEISTMNTTEKGESLEILGRLKMAGHPVLEGIFDNWLLQKEFHPVLRGNEIKEYYQLIRPQVAFPEYPNDAVQFGYFFYFNEGGVYAWTEKEMTDDELKIYRRFTTVLSLTYKRYKDLKDAEANAHEAVKRASLDRVRAEIASMRTVDDLQRITPLVWHELTTLGVPFVRCGVFIINEATAHVQVFLSSPDGKSLAALDLPFDSSELTLNSVNHWRQGIIFKTHWNKQEFLDFMQSMIKEGQVQNRETYQGAEQPPESLHLHFVPFKQGMLYVGNTSPLEKEALELVKALAESFSIAYARYEDFRQLESAKNQIEKTFTELKAAQAQLIQAEKMASLGELTAGIAHEIQNPLNFVNNFSEISNELVDEMKEELEESSRQYAAGSRQSGEEKLKLAEEIAGDIKQNLEKINHHGKRAADIVKGMLQHSRTSSGVKEPTDINALADEYLRLAYHGLRAKDKSFNAEFKTDFDPNLPKINVIPQDIGRVLLNLINNAFYAVRTKQAPLLPQSSAGFKDPEYNHAPTVTVSTSYLPPSGGMRGACLVRVSDNGPGIPAHIVDKIFQPFFTTKPTGQGTGLGLSLSYDIVKAHGGEIKVETQENEGFSADKAGTKFIITLPAK